MQGCCKNFIVIYSSTEQYQHPNLGWGEHFLINKLRGSSTDTLLSDILDIVCGYAVSNFDMNNNSFNKIINPTKTKNAKQIWMRPNFFHGCRVG